MKRTKSAFLGMLVISLVFGMMAVSCGDGGDGDGGKVTPPTVINGYYGVTADGKSMEVIITGSSSANIKSRAVSFGASNTYVIKIDGVKVSQGTVTKSGETFTFTPSDGSSVTVSSVTSGIPMISVEKDGKTYAASKIVEASDYFYAVGGPTSQSFAQIQQAFKGKTPEQIFTYYKTIVSDYNEEEGKWDVILAFGKEFDCPNSELNRISSEMNSGKISGVGYYSHKEYGNIVYYVSRLPFSLY